MTERERLIELIGQSKAMESSGIDCKVSDEYIADYLLANGVIVPPYKVGDIVYVITDKLYWKVKVRSVWYRKSEWVEDDFVAVEYEDGEIKSFYGREIYFTKEEAEQALKGGAKE